MKKVAGFQSFLPWILVVTFEESEFLKAFGMIECHIEGRATRGRFSVDEYARRFRKC